MSELARGSARHPGPRVIHWPPEAGPLPMIRDDLALAVYWCCLSRLRPQRDAAFYDAESEGLLTHEGVWDTTAEGQCYLAQAIHEAPYA